MADEPTDLPQNQDEPGTDEPTEPIELDNKKVASAIGRIPDLQSKLDKQGEFNEQILTQLTQLSETIQGLQIPQNRNNPGQFGTDPNLTVFGERLQDSLLSGDPQKVVEAFDLYYETRRQAESNISNSNKQQVDKLLGQLQGPYLKEIKDNVQKMAYQLVGQGKDPETAVDLAYSKNHALFSDSLIATVNQSNPEALEMLGDKGKGRDGTVAPKKWPKEVEEAWERDSSLKKGDKPMFKDKWDWLSKSPAVQKAYDLTVPKKK